MVGLFCSLDLDHPKRLYDSLPAQPRTPEGSAIPVYVLLPDRTGGPSICIWAEGLLAAIVAASCSCGFQDMQCFYKFYGMIYHSM